MKTFLQAQNVRALDRYDTFFGIKASEFPLTDVDAVVRFMIPDIEDTALIEASKPMHTSGIQKGVEDVNKLTTAEAVSSVSSTKVVFRLETLGQGITRVNDSTKVFLRHIILNGIKEDLSIYDIRDNIQKAGVDEYYQGRSLNIARTETRLAYDAGNKIAYDEIGIVKFDVVGCVGTLAGTNSLGLSASYGDFSESIGSCGVLEVDMYLWDAVSQSHHPSHGGSQVASDIPI